jgi:hypothetical protein
MELERTGKENTEEKSRDMSTKSWVMKETRYTS